MIVALIFLMGIFSAMKLQRQVDPTIKFDILKITTVYPGAAPEDVEINVTNKIEDTVQEVPNIKRMTSLSMENISVIFVEVNTDSGDPEETKNKIKDAVYRVTDLPQSVTQKPSVEELGTANVSAMEIALSGDVSEQQLRKHAKELESIIREVDGVRKVAKVGYRKREIKINIDLEKMKKASVSFAEIIQAVKNRNVRVTGGTIESYIAEKKVLTLAEYMNPMDVKNVIVRSNYEGYSERLTDVAEVTDGFEEPVLMYRGNGSSGISLVITAQETADIIKLSDRLQEKFKTYKENLPENVKAEIIIDFSIYTRLFLGIVANNAIFGFILVFIVMYIFLDFRSAFWSAFGIPFSFLGAFILFPLFGIKLHVTTLATMILVLGIVVDDAIVITESIYTNKQSGQENKKATLTGVKQMVFPVFGAVSTTVLAFLPILFIPGIMGKFMKDIPLVVLLTLGMSTVEAIFFLPSHMLHSRPPEKEPKRIQWLKYVIGFYHSSIRYALKSRYLFLGAFLGLMLAIFFISGKFLKFSLNEQEDRDLFTLLIETPQGTSLQKTASMIPDVEKILTGTISPKDLKSFTTQIGHHDTTMIGAGGGQYSNWAIIYVYLVPAQNRDIKAEEIIKKLKPELEKLQKEKGFQRLSVEQMGGPPIGKALSVTYISNDDELREKYEKETMEFLKTIKGVENVETTNVKGKNEVQLALDYARLSQYGLTALDVAQTVRTALDGTVVTSIRREGEDIDYRVSIKNPKEIRESLILDLPVTNKEGKLVPLKSFTQFKEKDGVSALRHYFGKRSVTVTSDIDVKKTTSSEVNKLIKDKFESRVAREPGIRMKFEGQEAETNVSMDGYISALIVALTSIYFILVVLFKSYKQPFMIISVIPFAVAGSFLTLLVHNITVSFTGLIGILGLIGVAVNDSIVMISHLNSVTESSGLTIESIAGGAKDRFRAVILTTLTTFAGLIPTAYGIGGDFPMMRQLVLVMAWGLVFATTVTLGFIPILYSIIKKRKGLV